MTGSLTPANSLSVSFSTSNSISILDGIGVAHLDVGASPPCPPSSSRRSKSVVAMLAPDPLVSASYLTCFASRLALPPDDDDVDFVLLVESGAPRASSSSSSVLVVLVVVVARSGIVALSRARSRFKRRRRRRTSVEAGKISCSTAGNG